MLKSRGLRVKVALKTKLGSAIKLRRLKYNKNCYS